MEQCGEEGGGALGRGRRVGELSVDTTLLFLCHVNCCNMNIRE